MINTVYVIAGPTATGKSSLSTSLANKINGSVINSDSMQVYKNLKILTARPSSSEMRNIDHHLYGFVDGKPIDAFQGAKPESKIEEMINKLIDATPGNEVPKLLEEADNLFKDHKFEEAQKIYESIVGMDPGNPKVIGGLLRCLVQLKKYDDAKEMMESLDDETLKNEEISKINKLLTNLEKDEGGDIQELKISVTNDPDNKQKRFVLAERYLSSNETGLGFNELLTIFEKDPKWNDEAAKKKLLEYFDLLGFNDPNVLEARKKLSSLMFK